MVTIKFNFKTLCSFDVHSGIVSLYVWVQRRNIYKIKSNVYLYELISIAKPEMVRDVWLDDFLANSTAP